MEKMIKDFTKIAKEHKGKWVALTDNEEKVIASGKSAKDALEKAKEQGFKNPILFKVPISLGNIEINPETKK